MSRSHLQVGLLALLLSLVGAAPALAQFQAYTASELNGSQNFGGPLGLDFDVNQPITVTQLGVFDSGDNGLSLNLTAELWDRNTQTRIAFESFTPGDPGTLSNGFRLKDIVALDLAPGQYTISGQGFGAGESNGNVGTGSSAALTNDGGGLISFVGSARFGNGGPNVFPGTADGGPPSRYHSGTFVFQATPEPPAVPEPSSFIIWGIVGLAMGGAAWWRRRRS